MSGRGSQSARSDHGKAAIAGAYPEARSDWLGGRSKERQARLMRSFPRRLMLAACGVGLLIVAAMPIRAVESTVPLAASAGHRAQFEAALADFDRAQEIQVEQRDQARLLYLAAAQRFEGIASDVENGRLEYNIGNCYLQAGDLGRAILHYRRAQRLMPRDSLLADNLAEARSRRLTNIAAGRAGTLLRNVFFWHFETSPTGRKRAAVALFAMTWVLLTVRVFRRRRAWLLAAGACVIASLGLTASLSTQRWLERTSPPGVVLDMDVVVYKGPGAGYQRQFEQPLQPGTEFTLRERRGTWWNIELPDGQRGWIDRARAALVIDDDPAAVRL